MSKALAIVVVCVLVSFSDACGQSVLSDFDFIVGKRAASDTVTERKVVTDEKSTSELSLFATGLIRFYQVFISTQDVPSCRFKPSCSNFTSEAIREGGAVRGILLGADRLTRCHWFSRPQYHVHCNHHQEIPGICDPVEIYLHDD